jgi:cbb3-type cytochrome oxidase subunit 1
MRYGIWLIVGLGIGLLQATTIVYTVAQLTPLELSRGRLRVILLSVFRYGLTLLVMTVAIQYSVVACALVGLGLILGRWCLVYLSVSDRLAWSRLP